MSIENNLLDMEWDKDDFFQEEKASEKTPEKTPEKKEEKKVEEEPTNFFEEEKTEVVSTDSFTIKYAFKDLKEAGVFKNVELEEDIEVDEEKFFELQQQDVDLEVEKRLKSWATDELDEDARDFIKFKLQGGDTKDFFKAVSKTKDLPQGQVEDEDYQDTVIRYQLAQEGWDAEEVEDRLEHLTKTGKKRATAEKYDIKIKQEIQANKASELKRVEEAKKAEAQNEKLFKDTIKKSLDDNTEIKGFTLTAQEKPKLLDFLTKKEYKVGDKSITGFQRKLAEVFQDTDKLLLLAKLINSDFDMTSYEKKVKTKYTEKIQDNLQQRSASRPGGFGSSQKGIALADLFN
jgi:hypothetical protein